MAVTEDADPPNVRRGLQLATRSAVSATLAFSIAQALKLDYPIFALAAAVIATDLTPARSRELGFRRLIATAIGGLGLRRRRQGRLRRVEAVPAPGFRLDLCAARRSRRWYDVVRQAVDRSDDEYNRPPFGRA